MSIDLKAINQQYANSYFSIDIMNNYEFKYVQNYLKRSIEYTRVQLEVEETEDNT